MIRKFAGSLISGLNWGEHPSKFRRDVLERLPAGDARVDDYLRETDEEARREEARRWREGIEKRLNRDAEIQTGFERIQKRISKLEAQFKDRQDLARDRRRSASVIELEES